MPTYDTLLSPEDEQKFTKWAAERINETHDYDLRGYWNKYGRKQDRIIPVGKGHLTDEFKKPNHMTFSNNSIYSNPTTPGGIWNNLGNNQWSYQPTQHTLNTVGVDRLKQYFKEKEVGNLLLLPSGMQ